MTTYHGNKPAQALAIAVGATATAITAANLIGPEAKLGLPEATTLGLLACTIGVGILGKVSAAQRRIGYAAAFLATFTLGTALVVYNSVGGQHGTAAKAETEATNANKALHALEGERDRIDGRIAVLRTELRRFAGVPSSLEVKGKLDAVVGVGPDKVGATVWRRTNGCSADQITKADRAEACKPALALRELNGRALAKERIERELAAENAQRSATIAKIEAAGGERPVPVKARGFAEAAGLLGFQADRVEFVMSRLDKVIAALALELVAVFALEYGLAGLFMARSPASVAPIAPVAETAAPEAPRPAPPKGSGRRGRKVDPNVISFADQYRDRHGKAPGGADLMAAFPGMPKSTAYDYAKRVA